jgi:hypothetical protein
VRTQNGHRVVLVAGLPIAHYAVGWRRDGQRSKPAQAGGIAAGRTECGPNLSGSAALAGLLRQARLAPPFPGTGCASVMRSRPEIRTVQSTGMSGGLESGHYPTTNSAGNHEQDCLISNIRAPRSDAARAAPLTGSS